MCSYILAIVSTGLVFGAVIPLIDSLPAQIFLGLLYVVVLLWVSVLTIRLTLYDPTEINTVKTKYFLSKNIRIKLEGEWKHQCLSCDSVVGPNVHHCKQCDRCVADLDHHCKWVNNCVTKDNYALFLNLLRTAILFILLNALLDILATLLVLLQTSPKYYGRPMSNATVIYIMCASVGLIHLILFILAVKLYIFHLWLMRNNLTTLQYIMSARENSRNKVLPKVNIMDANMNSLDVAQKDTERNKLATQEPSASTVNKEPIVSSQTKQAPTELAKSNHQRAAGFMREDFKAKRLRTTNPPEQEEANHRQADILDRLPETTIKKAGRRLPPLPSNI